MVIGHHHISMYTKNVGKNDYFYQEILGLHRVKVSVNQDDPFMYHVFYGDLTGSPGTELTLFEIPLIGYTYPGTNAITKTGLLVPSYQSLLYWQERFYNRQVKLNTFCSLILNSFIAENGNSMLHAIAAPV